MKRATIKYLVVSVIIIMSLLLGSGCELLPEIETSPPPSPPDTTPTTTPTPIDPNWTLPPIESNALVLPSIADVVAEVKPSVVAINTEAVAYDIFRQPFTQEGAGSGWIIREDGIIVTNNHVIAGAQSITVSLTDGRTFPVDINTVATDPLTDLAILKIDAENLIAASRGASSKLKVGDWLVAIGNPLGLGISAKEGIVSRLEVSISLSSGQTLYDLIETSAAINPGNSGGPLVNMAGEVIGITSVKIATIGVEGMGYAISIDTADPIIEELVNTGYVVRPWLGIVFSSVDQWPAVRYDLAVNKGAFISQVMSGSPADKAGLEAGDVIVSLNGQEITTGQELVQAIHSHQIGQEIEITFWRDDVRKTTYVILIESPPPS